MYQAYDGELLNQKESENEDSGRILDQELPQHPLYVATRRLVKALDQLETNLKQGMPAPNGHDKSNEKLAFFERENAILKEERESLNHSIASLQHQYNDLQNVASTIHRKLDTSIKKLSKILDE